MTDLRKIDAMVAEHVMGWRLDGVRWRDAIDTFVRGKLDWRPSTDIAAAWSVVEKLKCVPGSEHDLVNWWCAGVAATPQGTWLADVGSKRVEAQTAPLAICLAALKAKGIDVEKMGVP